MILGLGTHRILGRDLLNEEEEKKKSDFKKVPRVEERKGKRSYKVRYKHTRFLQKRKRKKKSRIPFAVVVSQKIIKAFSHSDSDIYDLFP